jgi:plastocyanin
MPASRTPLALALLAAALAACGSASTNSTDQTSAAKVKPGRVAVAISPATVTVPAGGTVAFHASVRGAKNVAVTWSLAEPTGCGSIAASGVYTAPGAAASCHVIATSVADPTASAEAAATVTAPPAPPPPPPPPPSSVAVTISPGSAAVDACRTLAFQATVSGASSSAVTWSVQEGSVGGSITQAGVYTAPSVAGTYHVLATSQAAPTSSATVAVTVAERILGVAVSPGTTTLTPGATAQFTATVTTTCGTAVASTTVTGP